MGSYSTNTPHAIAQEIGQRLKQARLNQNQTQANISERAGVSRRTVMKAEQGNATLEEFIAILDALNMTNQLDNFLPVQTISPIQLLKLQGKTRQRASNQNHQPLNLKHNEVEW